MNILNLSNNQRKKFSCIAIFCGTVVVNSHAIAQGDSGASTSTADIASYDDGDGVYNEATYGSKSQLARVWELSDEEVDRYIELKIKDRHFSDGQISPIEVLGKYARNEDEGRHYATRFVALMKQQSTNAIEWRSYVQQAETDSLNERILEILETTIATQQEFRKADLPVAHFKNQVRDEQLGIDKSPEAKIARISKPDVRFFVDVNDCNADCSTLWDKLREEQTTDVYGMLAVIFVNEPSRDEIRAWVSKSGITENDLNLLKVRLDHENEVYAKYRKDNPAPYAIDTSRNVIQ
ncbi:hypothetical protein OAM69_03890 [bacterium]|nr:hypothetical protein [bacterium]